MIHFKDLDASIALLQAVLARSDIGAEQKKYVEQAIGHLRGLRRKAHCKPRDLYRPVREVTSLLLRAFQSK